MIAWQLNGGSFTASRLIQGQLLRTLLPVLAVALGCLEDFFLGGGLFSPSLHPTSCPGWKAESC